MPKIALSLINHRLQMICPAVGTAEFPSKNVYTGTFPEDFDLGEELRNKVLGLTAMFEAVTSNALGQFARKHTETDSLCVDSKECVCMFMLGLIVRCPCNGS